MGFSSVMEPGCFILSPNFKSSSEASSKKIIGNLLCYLPCCLLVFFLHRIVANRQSAQRSRIRKLHYISELEESVTALEVIFSVPCCYEIVVMHPYLYKLEQPCSSYLLLMWRCLTYYSAVVELF